jgi:hypothetical protein
MKEASVAILDINKYVRNPEAKEKNITEINNTIIGTLKYFFANKKYISIGIIISS